MGHPGDDHQHGANTFIKRRGKDSFSIKIRGQTLLLLQNLKNHNFNSQIKPS